MTKVHGVGVTYEASDRLARIVLDRPEAMNALDTATKDGLLDALREAPQELRWFYVSPAALFGSFAIGWSGYLGVLGLVVIVGLVTALTSRLTVTRQLAAIDMLSPVER